MEQSIGLTGIPCGLGDPSIARRFPLQQNLRPPEFEFVSCLAQSPESRDAPLPSDVWVRSSVLSLIDLAPCRTGDGQAAKTVSKSSCVDSCTPPRDLKCFHMSLGTLDVCPLFFLSFNSWLPRRFGSFSHTSAYLLETEVRRAVRTSPRPTCSNFCRVFLPNPI